ncbi:MAG: bifunctional phosphoglucose/phosphomannose isomerase [Candidatus Moranbacteria bacterium RIFCSPHIGHO2_01_FULL_55_24]|nr:MAG: bifunctional phosphoglucose/phosphomannose isomerase [Candidatus Moranbacteria bacterium RIFCSPHIGHO2_01_FULL_55_24]
MQHELDTSNFRGMILESPDQFQTGFDLAKDVRVPGSFDSIVISGMGGSALPSDLLAAYLRDIATRHSSQTIRVFQNRFYSLASDIPEKNTLYFFCSYSGNTEETLESFEEALRRELPCIGMSAGGKLETLCAERGVPHIKLPLPSPGFQPRMGTGFFIGALLQVLMNQEMIPDVREEVLAGAREVKENLASLEEEGKALSEKLRGKTPVIYAGDRLRSVAMVWKIKLNENAKTPAFWNYFPELNHNEMVGFSLPQAKFFVIMLRDTDDHPRNQKRFDITAELLREKGVEVEVLDMKGKNVFNRVFMSIALGDFTSYYLALAYGQDPTPVHIVEKLKKLLTS